MTIKMMWFTLITNTLKAENRNCCEKKIIYKIGNKPKFNKGAHQCHRQFCPWGPSPGSPARCPGSWGGLTTAQCPPHRHPPLSPQQSPANHSGPCPLARFLWPATMGRYKLFIYNSIRMFGIWCPYTASRWQTIMKKKLLSNETIFKHRLLSRATPSTIQSIKRCK